MNYKNIQIQTPFFDLFGSTSALIIDQFLMLRELDYSETDIAQKTKLSRKTVSKEIKKLLEKKVIKLTRKMAKSNMYIFNDVKENQWLKDHFDMKIGHSDNDSMCTSNDEPIANIPLQQVLQYLEKLKKNDKKLAKINN